MTGHSSFDLSAARTIPWARPEGCPAKFEPHQIHTGSDDGDLALEIGTAKWLGTESPSRDAFTKLHRDRAGRGINPVVIVAFTDDHAWIFGPNPQAAVVGAIAVEHAQRLLQSALNEPSGLDARRNLNQSFEAIAATSTGGQESDALRGVGNAGLFATHELRNGVRSRADWSAAVARSKDMMSLRKTELIKRLGYSLEDVGGNASLLKSGGENPRAVAVILLDNETFDGQSNRFAVSPVAFGLQVADRKEVAWLILLRKDAIRLYPARLDLGVGRKGLAETYFELNLAVADDSTAGFLSLIFSADALAENGSCYEILKSSSQYAVGLGARLRDKVYGEIVPQLSLAVASRLPKLGVPMDRDGLNRAYQITLRIFFRMLFQAYADDRKLLPYGENDDYTKNAIKGFAKKLIDDDELEFDNESSSYWDDLIQVWRAIDTGSKRFGIPAYNGGLFSSDEDLQPEGALIERLRLTDDIIGPVLRALLIDVADDGTIGPIDFRSLSVREFGTIYEGLLESNLGLADTDLILDDKDTWIPAPKGAKLEPGRSAKKGTVYFHDTSGARKGTGSYFTPSFVVEHLLERSLDPALDAHLERVKAVLESGDQVGAADLFFDFKVADLAMGSAHFLTAAIDHIEQHMAGFLDAHPIPGVTNELRRLEEAAKEKLGDNATVPEPSSLLRRQIARRCIYGLDINPVSVELARVSIWIHTFVRGLPMSSLDHTLVCANSLTGIGTVDEALNVLVPGRRGGQITLFDGPIEDALSTARDVLTEVAKSAELDSKESKAASRASLKARKDAEEAKLLFDAAVLTRIGRGGLVAGDDPSKIAQMAADPTSQAALEPLQPAHMPLLFPEVFLRNKSGFDVLIGNPPWEKIKVEEHQWWGLRHPGLRGLPMAERTKLIQRLRAERPDLVAEYEAEVENTNTARKIMAAGPYPGIGSGDIDLYKAFAWRNWQLLRDEGSLGVVLPRGALNGSGTQQWRREILEKGTFSDVVVTINTGHWVFTNVDGRYTTALVIAEKRQGAGFLRFAGPFPNMTEFLTGRDNLVDVEKDEFLSWTGTAAFPLIPDALAGDVFRQMRKSPAFSSTEGFEFRPAAELHATQDRALFNTNLTAARGEVPVLTGSSFNLWEADFGDPYAYGSSKTVKHILDKTRNSANMARSAFNGMTFATADDLPMNSPRIAFRDVTNATNTRTMVSCLLPPGVTLVHKAPYLVRRAGTESDEAYILGVLSSRIFDWYTRRLVELAMTFEVLMPVPVPRPAANNPLRARVITIAGSLAAVDERFATWAKAVGVPVGSVQDEERLSMEAELDALVALLYGLTREHVEHIFKTFHRGWDYEPRLTLVLGFFDSIAKAKK
jgi:hypothetical protein